MIEQQSWHGTPIYIIENDALKLYLCPSIGNNLYRIEDKIAGRDILRYPDSPQPMIAETAHFGTPLLLPPSRITDGTFHYQGIDYQFEINHAYNNSIHGFIRNHPWSVTNINDQPEQCEITSRFHTSKFPDILQQYPHELEIEVSYFLKGTSVKQITKITNLSKLPAPVGYGLHTWFLIDGEPEQWRLELPVSSYWELNDRSVPTGQLLPLGKYEELIHGMSLKNCTLDTVFQIGDYPRRAILAKEGYEITYSASEPFKQWVIYTKGEADQFICLEPYTWAPNAPNLNVDPEISGFKALESGETMVLEVDLSIRHS